MPGSWTSPPKGARHHWLTLLAIGTGAGVQSGLFGVGGGALMVPLLMLWLGMSPRQAAATSIAAIVVIAAAGTLTHTAYGNVRWAEAGVLAVPAIAGAVAGTALQQRVRKEWISGCLALLLIVMGIDFLIEGLA